MMTCFLMSFARACVIYWWLFATLHVLLLLHVYGVLHAKMSEVRDFDAAHLLSDAMTFG